MKEVASQDTPLVNIARHHFMGTMSFILTWRLNIILVIYVEGNPLVYSCKYKAYCMRAYIISDNVLLCAGSIRESMSTLGIMITWR